MKRAFRELTGSDREWSLDHSRRAYRVRPSRASDWADGVLRSDLCITIVRMWDGALMPLMEQCERSPGPAEDSDTYASFRIGLVNRSRKARGQAEV